MPYKDKEAKNANARKNYYLNKEKEKERKAIFYKNNKEKVDARNKAYSETPAGIKSTSMRMWRYLGVKNVNDEMYERYINTTNCDVCNKEFKNSMDRHLDHDHETGEMRWVLCCSCNANDNWKKYFM